VCNLIEEGTEKWLVPEAPRALATFFEHHVPRLMQQSAGAESGPDASLPYFVVDIEQANTNDELVFTFSPVGTLTGLRIDAIVVPAGAGCASGGG